MVLSLIHTNFLWILTFHLRKYTPFLIYLITQVGIILMDKSSHKKYSFMNMFVDIVAEFLMTMQVFNDTFLLQQQLKYYINWNVFFNWTLNLHLQGHLVLLPLNFLSKENLTPASNTVEGMMPTSLWTWNIWYLLWRILIVSAHQTNYFTINFNFYSNY